MSDFKAKMHQMRFRLGLQVHELLLDFDAPNFGLPRSEYNNFPRPNYGFCYASVTYFIMVSLSREFHAIC